MSTLRVNTIQDTAGSGSPAINGLARAWVNFNGTGTVAIRASLNVSSITDNGTGDYTVNFTTALADANYAVTTSCLTPFDGRWFFGPNFHNQVHTTTQLRLLAQANLSYFDMSQCEVAIFR